MEDFKKCSLVLCGAKGGYFNDKEIYNSEWNGAEREEKTPGFYLIHLPGISTVKEIASTSKSICLLCSDGALYSWGSAPSSYCGHGENTNPKTPCRIEMLASENVVSLCSGKEYYICSTDDGRSFSWGNSKCCLGHGDGVSILHIPSAIESLNGVKCTAMRCTDNNCFALTDKKQLYTWGVAGDLLGNGSAATVSSAMPLLSSSISEVCQIFAGCSHVGAITSDKVTYMWGSNSNGECFPLSASGISTSIVIPKAVDEFIPGKKLNALALGKCFSLGLTTGGEVYAWGSNEHGQLGLGHTHRPCPPTKIIALQSREILSIEAGHHSVACHSTENKVFSWGYNNHRQLGHSDTNVWTVPREIDQRNYSDDAGIGSIHMTKLPPEGPPTIAVLRHSHSLLNKKESLRRLVSDIQKQFNVDSAVGKDFTIICGKRKLHVDKFMLRARSEFFEAMFKSDMKKECAEKSMCINCTCYEVVLEMVRWIYTGAARIKSDYVVELVEVSMAYGLMELVELAALHVEKVLCVDNAMQLLIEADRIGAKQLRAIIVTFVMAHWSTFGKSEVLEQLPHQLLIELVRTSVSTGSSSSGSE